MSAGHKHPIPDKGQVAIDFPDKFYMGAFGKEAKFEAGAEGDGLFIKLFAAADKREVQVHLHHFLLAEILEAWAASLKHEPKMSKDHRDRLVEALKHVQKAL